MSYTVIITEEIAANVAVTTQNYPITIEYNATNIGAGTTYGNSNVSTLLASFGSNSISTTGNVTAAYFVGDGSQLTGLPGGLYGNADVSNYLASGTNTANIVTAGNVQGAFVKGNGSALSAITGANVTGTVANATYATSAGTATTAGTANVANSVAGANVSGAVAQATQAGTANVANSVAGANVTGAVAQATQANAANTAVTVTGAAQANITSVGTLTGLSVSGNVTAGNLAVTADAVITGNLTVNGTTTTINSNVVTVNDKTFVLANNQSTGAGVDGSGIIAGNPAVASILYDNASVTWKTNIGVGVTGAVSASGNVTGANLITSGIVYTPQVEAAGDLDLNTAGTVNVNGNIRVGDNNTNTQIATHGTGDLILRTHAGDANQGSITIFDGANGDIALAPNGTGRVTAGIISASGNITGANFIGDGSRLTNLTGANVTGNVSSALFAINAGTASTANTAGTSTFADTANAVAGANVSGTVASATVAATVSGAAQANITSVGTLSNLSVTGNITNGGNITSNSLVAGSLLSSTQSSGDEGGQIELALPATNTTLNGGVAIDLNQDRLRIFETGGTNRGAYIDLSSTSAGVGTNLLAGGGTPGGSNTQIQFNNGGAFAGNAAMTFNNSTGNIGLGNVVVNADNIRNVNAINLSATPSPQRITVGSGYNGNFGANVDPLLVGRGGTLAVIDKYNIGNADTNLAQRMTTSTLYADMGGQTLTNGGRRLQPLQGALYIGNGTQTVNAPQPVFATATGIGGAVGVGNITLAGTTVDMGGTTTVSHVAGAQASILVGGNANVGNAAGYIAAIQTQTAVTANTTSAFGYGLSMPAAFTSTVAPTNVYGYYMPGTTATHGININNNWRRATNYYFLMNEDDVAQNRLGSLRRYHEFNGVSGTTSGSLTIDKNAGQVQQVNLAGNISSVAFSNFVSSASDSVNTDEQCDTVTIAFNQGATGGYGVTFPTGSEYKYAGNVRTLQSTAANSVSLVSVSALRLSGTTTYLITISPGFVS